MATISNPNLFHMPGTSEPIYFVLLHKYFFDYKVPVTRYLIQSGGGTCVNVDAQGLDINPHHVIVVPGAEDGPPRKDYPSWQNRSHPSLCDFDKNMVVTSSWIAISVSTNCLSLLEIGWPLPPGPSSQPTLGQRQRRYRQVQEKDKARFANMLALIDAFDWGNNSKEQFFKFAKIGVPAQGIYPECESFFRKYETYLEQRIPAGSYTRGQPRRRISTPLKTGRYAAPTTGRMRFSKPNGRYPVDFCEPALPYSMT